MLSPGAAQVGGLKKGMGGEWKPSGFHLGLLTGFFLLRAGCDGALDTEGCTCVFLQEAGQELLTQVQPMLASVAQGYNIALLLQGQEREAPRFVPQVRCH